MEKIYKFKYKDDKIIELNYDCESMECLYCHGVDVEPSEAIIVFGNNLAVDFICPQCNEKFRILPLRNQWKIIDEAKESRAEKIKTELELAKTQYEELIHFLGSISRAELIHICNILDIEFSDELHSALLNSYACLVEQCEEMQIK